MQFWHPIWQWRIVYLLRVQGEILKDNQKEFQQFGNSLSKQVSEMCHKCSIEPDMLKDDKFYFDAIWTSKNQLYKFMDHDLYKAIIGAFKVLGKYDNTTINELNI